MSHIELHTPEAEAERREQARRRVEELAKRQNVKPFNYDEMKHLTWPEEDPGDEFLKFLREIRGGGKKQE